MSSDDFGKFFNIMRIASALSRIQKKNVTCQIWSTTKNPETSVLMKQQGNENSRVV